MFVNRITFLLYPLIIELITAKLWWAYAFVNMRWRRSGLNIEIPSMQYTYNHIPTKIGRTIKTIEYKINPKPKPKLKWKIQQNLIKTLRRRRWWESKEKQWEQNNKVKDKNEIERHEEEKKRSSFGEGRQNFDVFWHTIVLLEKRSIHVLSKQPKIHNQWHL